MKHFLNSKVRVVLLIAVVLLVAFALLTRSEERPCRERVLFLV